MNNSSAPKSNAHSLRRPRGVRRRREDPASPTVEIEELDSAVMRQNSYNYFERHPSPRVGPIAGASSGTTEEDLRDAYASKSKRQRTLAEQLENLCLHPDPNTGAASSSSSSPGATATRPPGMTAAAACRQAWKQMMASQLVARQQRNAALAATKAAAAATHPDVEMEVDTQQTTSGSAAAAAASSSAAEDADLDDNDDGEDDDEDGQTTAGLRVLGGLPDVKGIFFGSASGHQRPMERMFRHYVTMAAERSSRGENCSSPRGDELVLFQPGPTSLEFPYSLFTPEQVEDLRARHNRKKKRQAAQDRVASPSSRTNHTFATSHSRSSSSLQSGYMSDTATWRFQELDSSDEADVSSSADDSDMDLSTDESAAGPQLAGALSHGEWFVEANEDDDDDDDL